MMRLPRSSPWRRAGGKEVSTRQPRSLKRAQGRSVQSLEAMILTRPACDKTFGKLVPAQRRAVNQAARGCIWRPFAACQPLPFSGRNCRSGSRPCIRWRSGLKARPALTNRARIIAGSRRRTVCGTSARRNAVDGVIHPAVFFNERFHARVARQPVLRAIVRTRILHEVLELDTLLVGDGGDAEFEPVRIAETRRDDGKCHRRV